MNKVSKRKEMKMKLTKRKNKFSKSQNKNNNPFWGNGTEKSNNHMEALI